MILFSPISFVSQLYINDDNMNYRSIKIVFLMLYQQVFGFLLDRMIFPVPG
jgi:hypothetical protein